MPFLCYQCVCSESCCYLSSSGPGVLLLQLLSVLLDAFHAEIFVRAVSDAAAGGVGSPPAAAPGAGITGFSPFGNRAVAGGSPDAVEVQRDRQRRQQTESMHVSCKALSILIKYRPGDAEGFTELIVTRLCTACSFAPVTIGLQCEQLLGELARLNPPRVLRVITPFASLNPPVSVPAGTTDGSGGDTDGGVQMRLLALHVLASTIKLVPSPQLLREISSILDSVLPSFSSALVDVRKGVVFVLVELYGVVGDALYPYVTNELTPPQKKLLAIYVQRFKAGQRAGVAPAGGPEKIA